MNTSNLHADLSSVCRALGLPCRSITNFESAHDTDANATIDKYFKIEDGKRVDLRGMASDSIWYGHNKIYTTH